MTQWLVALAILAAERHPVTVNSSGTRSVVSHSTLWASAGALFSSLRIRCHFEMKHRMVSVRSKNENNDNEMKGLGDSPYKDTWGDSPCFESLKAIRLEKDSWYDSPRFQYNNKGDSRRFAWMKIAEAIHLIINVIKREAIFYSGKRSLSMHQFNTTSPASPSHNFRLGASIMVNRFAPAPESAKCLKSRRKRMRW